jgi:hypothetical protein
MTELTCPAEGCDIEKEPGALKKHIYAKADEEHSDSEALIGEVEDLLAKETGATSSETEGQQQEEEQDEGGEKADDAAASRDGSTRSTDDEQNQTDEDADSSTEQENDHPEDTPSDADMPTDDEYDRFTSGTSTEQTTPSDASSGGSTTDDGLELPGLPVDTWTLAMLAGLVLLLVLAWYWLRAGSDDGAEPIEIEDDQSDDNDDPTLIE